MAFAIVVPGALCECLHMPLLDLLNHTSLGINVFGEYFLHIRSCQQALYKKLQERFANNPLETRISFTFEAKRPAMAAAESALSIVCLISIFASSGASSIVFTLQMISIHFFLLGPALDGRDACESPSGRGLFSPTLSLFRSGGGLLFDGPVLRDPVKIRSGLDCRRSSRLMPVPRRSCGCGDIGDSSPDEVSLLIDHNSRRLSLSCSTTSLLTSSGEAQGDWLPRRADFRLRLCRNAL